MTKSEFRYAHHPEDVKKYTTEELREHFLIPELFVKNQISLTYTMYDRYIADRRVKIRKLFRPSRTRSN